MPAELQTAREAERLAWRVALVCAAFEGILAGAPVALLVALVGLLESGTLAWSVGALTGAMVAGLVFRLRRPARLESLARLDAGLGLGGALEVAVSGSAMGARSHKAIEAALSGRLERPRVVGAALELRWGGLALCAALTLGLGAVIQEETQVPLDLRAARLMEGRPVADALAEAEEPPDEEQEAASREREGADEERESEVPGEERSAREARAQAERGGPQDGEGERGAGADPQAPGAAGTPSGASEVSKLAAQAPSGVTQGSEGGKIGAMPASPTSGAWWPARHDAIVRAWLDSRASLNSADGR